MNLISRYLTLSVAKNNPTEKLNSNPYKIKMGNKSISKPGAPIKTQRRIMRITNDIKKSIKQTIKDERGIIILGK
jgi:hypothetical protein